MTNDYKKGDLVALTYVIGNEKFCSNGIILSVSDTILTIGHNFSHTTPIDVTKIPIKAILEGKKITPKEINSLDDINLTR